MGEYSRFEIINYLFTKSFGSYRVIILFTNENQDKIIVNSMMGCEREDLVNSFNAAEAYE